jgi:lactoylglutathione lyase
VADIYDFENFTLIYLSNAESEFEVELTVNKGQETSYDLGNGYGHIAFSVEDIKAEHAKLSSRGSRRVTSNRWNTSARRLRPSSF